MHIPDGFLDFTVCAVTYAGTILFWALSLRKVKASLTDRQIPLMATLTAMFFAAQMMNYPIIGGTTAHLLGGPAVALTLGPYAGMISMTIILVIQALFFGDGGVTTLGANVWNMGVVGVFVPYAVCLASVKLWKSSRALLAGAFAGAFLGDLLAAIFAGLELGLSTIFPYAAPVAVAAMGIHHSVIGVGEGIVTAGVLKVLLKSRPDLLQYSSLTQNLIQQGGSR
ncbi:energy-coupling factor ABC transporter permease [Candidatus Bathyarchaeota archaeon]|nr:energy-coupling factor ABC transporter permease [Candidatus Bathyarchaeota archaeon]